MHDQMCFQIRNEFSVCSDSNMILIFTVWFTVCGLDKCIEKVTIAAWLVSVLQWLNLWFLMWRYPAYAIIRTQKSERNLNARVLPDPSEEYNEVW
jgi:hypothetical protein